MTMLKQVYTHLNSLEMCEVSVGILPIINVRVYRHASDPTTGDSWFLQVVAEGTSLDGGKCPLIFVHKSTREHGHPKARECNMAAGVLMKGEINLEHWDYCCNH
jgi:hypothetical protein